jgi:hypothetical protein
MTSSKEYREHSKQCLKLARTSMDNEQRACLVALAKVWATNAENLERGERRRADKLERNLTVSPLIFRVARRS